MVKGIDFAFIETAEFEKMPVRSGDVTISVPRRFIPSKTIFQDGE
ncbi:hypothetical protein [Desulfopila sp. IMCC35006]|nr:hypothetical protein [Desulfopila sp. IMCC35006]